MRGVGIRDPPKRREGPREGRTTLRWEAQAGNRPERTAATSEPIGASATQQGKPRAGPSVASLPLVRLRLASSSGSDQQSLLVWIDLLNESINAVSVVPNGLACAPEILSTYQRPLTHPAIQ